MHKDLKRRDFTINSIAVELKRFRLIDPFNGLSDLILGRLQITDKNSFKEDPLRIYRCFRLAIKYNLKISEKTLRHLLLNAERLKEIYPERVFEELKKIILMMVQVSFSGYLKNWSY